MCLKVSTGGVGKEAGTPDRVSVALILLKDSDNAQHPLEGECGRAHVHIIPWLSVGQERFNVQCMCAPTSKQVLFI